MKKLSAENLTAFGFRQNKDEYGNFAWFHPRSNKFYYQILTPEQVKEIFCEMGRQEAFSKIKDFMEGSE
jgi:hypothetical protein